MKASFLAALLVLTAATTFAQLAPPNGVGVTMGHIHLSLKDIPTQERFLTEMMGGTVVKNGPLSLIQFPGIPGGGEAIAPQAPRRRRSLRLRLR